MNIMIILNYNDADVTQDYISRIVDYSILDKIIVVDNQSTDDSFQKLKLLNSSKVDVVQANENRGYSAGNNYGIKYAESQFDNIDNIIISNPDITVKEKTIEDIINVLDDKEYGMATGLIYNYDPLSGKTSIASNFGWILPTYFDMLCNCFLLVYKIRKSVFHNNIYLLYDEHKNKRIIDAEAVPGCFFAIKDSLLKQIEYMDEDTFLFGEETILGYKIKKKGFKVAIVNGTEILHENSTTIKKNIRLDSLMYKYRLQSELIYIRKYLSKNYIFQKIYVLTYKIGLLEKKIISKFMK